MTDLPEGYYQCAQKMAELELRLWVASGEPVDDYPDVWERWVLFCLLAGVDPVDFKEEVERLLASGATPLLVCGHPNIAANLYRPHGAHTDACRECARGFQLSRQERLRDNA